jgi:hypothetical protein
MDPLYLYRGGVTYVVSGNHYDVVLDTGFFLTIRVPVKLKGVELPAMRHRSSEERALAQAAKDAAMGALLSRWVLVGTEKEAHQPRLWQARVFLDATVPEEHSQVMTDVLGHRMVDFSAYMNAIRSENFDLEAIELRHAEKSKRSRKASPRGH